MDIICCMTFVSSKWYFARSGREERSAHLLRLEGRRAPADVTAEPNCMQSTSVPTLQKYPTPSFAHSLLFPHERRRQERRNAPDTGGGAFQRNDYALRSGALERRNGFLGRPAARDRMRPKRRGPSTRERTRKRCPATVSLPRCGAHGRQRRPFAPHLGARSAHLGARSANCGRPCSTVLADRSQVTSWEAAQQRAAACEDSPRRRSPSMPSSSSSASGLAAAAPPMGPGGCAGTLSMTSSSSSVSSPVGPGIAL